MDITAAMLPVIAVNFQNFTPLVVGLIPLPYSNFVGIAIGYCFSAFFLWLAILLGISRQQFGSAVEATAGLIPVIGPTAMNWVSKANFTAAKLNMRRKRVMESVSETLAVVSQFVDANVTPALDTLNQQVQQAATVASDVKDLASTQLANVRQQAEVARSLKSMGTEKLNALKSTGMAAANAKLDDLKSRGLSAATSKLGSLASRLKPAAGRKKFTRRRMNKKQWRKTRKSKTI